MILLEYSKAGSVTIFESSPVATLANKPVRDKPLFLGGTTAPRDADGAREKRLVPLPCMMK